MKNKNVNEAIQKLFGIDKFAGGNYLFWTHETSNSLYPATTVPHLNLMLLVTLCTRLRYTCPLFVWSLWRRNESQGPNREIRSCDAEVRKRGSDICIYIQFTSEKKTPQVY